MKNYIGVKIIKAQPGTMAEAQAMKNGCSREVQEKLAQKADPANQEGYIVKYPDGYISWSPKDVFEKAYRELDCEEFINSKE